MTTVPAPGRLEEGGEGVLVVRLVTSEPLWSRCPCRSGSSREAACRVERFEVGGAGDRAAMFSFHKPKIYRSALGCCICRAKSSSSRFTDSKKYEAEFARCFRIVAEDRRSGEICNACVLLVKRWKKLPPGTTRDWHHVVDARAGPGTKSGNKGKVKPPKRPLKKHHRLTAEKRCKLDLSGGALSDDIT
ncbi:hypothetical protein MRX96_047798, partial [Rhipicephalus microplus]